MSTLSTLAVRAGARQRRIKHIIRAHQSPRVRDRGPRSGQVPADFQHNDRLDARCGAQRAHEPSCIAHALDVQQDVLCAPVGDEVIENFTEINVNRTAQRYHAGKPDAARIGPVDDGRGKRP